jgi:hypothetical protein
MALRGFITAWVHKHQHSPLRGGCGQMYSGGDLLSLGVYLQVPLARAGLTAG